MARKPRIEYPGGIYHVIQRANNREFFFEDNAMKELLLDLITDYRKKLGFELFGYVIMSNHYHLIVRQTEISLHKVMHRILGETVPGVDLLTYWCSRGWRCQGGNGARC